MTYAVVSVTEYYGPRVDCVVWSLHKTIDEARAVADTHAPDYDSRVGAHRLAHNQSSPTRGEVYEVMSDIYDDREVYGADEDKILVCGDLDGKPYLLRYID